MRFPIRRLAVSTLLIGTCLTATAEIRDVVVTSGASFEPGLPSKGSIAAVFCTGLEGIDGIVSAAAVPLPTELAGVRVRVGGAAAPLFAVASFSAYQQVNIQVPMEALLGDQDAEVVVEQKGNQATVSAPLRLSTPGDFFRLPGTNYGVFQHAADYSLVTPENPASPGEVIIAYLSGMPGTRPAVPTGQPAPYHPLAVVPEYMIQNTEEVYYLIIGAGATLDQPRAVAERLFMGLSPGSIGVYQINFIVPRSVPGGPNPLVFLQRESCVLCSVKVNVHLSSPAVIPVRVGVGR
ncbi:MAG: hypothetical protein KIT09_24155 [Bryobacteraceae bacterium]|nr:hypothetical protein [Bryobacteraceae bacterium]